MRKWLIFALLPLLVAGKGGKLGFPGFLQRLDKDHNQEITREEFTAGWQELFTFLDTNKDGVLSEADKPEEGKESAWLKQKFMEWDVNKDGKVSREEFRGRPQMFEKLDANKDGFLTPDEVREQMKKGIQAYMGRIFSRIDTNSDKKITREEWKAAETSLFQFLDRNGDGVLNKADAPQKPSHPRHHNRSR
ncbi:MAG: EF-hand domain-containing protein [bacterium JZ-2024 1]